MFAYRSKEAYTESSAWLEIGIQLLSVTTRIAANFRSC